MYRFLVILALSTILLANAYEVRPRRWQLKAAKKMKAMARSQGKVLNETALPLLLARTAMRGNRSFLQSGSSVFTEETTILESVQWYAMLVYVIPSCGIFLWMVVFRRVSGIDGKLKERDAAMEEWEGTYTNLVNDLNECLGKTLDSEVELVEHGFNDLARDFRSDMKRMGGSSDFSKEELVRPFKAFVRHWVSSFEDWLLDPSEDPPPILTEAELDACSDVKEVSALMVTKLTDYTVDLTVSDGQEVQRLIDKAPKPAHACSWVQCCGFNSYYLFMQKPGDGGWPRSLGLSCIGLTLFSPKHVVLLGAFLVGPLVTFFELGTGGTWGWLYGLYISGAWICLLVILVLFEHIDELARVEVEIEDLKKKRAQIVHFHAEVKQKYDKITKFNNLWECRSLPCLRLMKSIFCHVYDAPEDALTLLNASSEGFKSLEQSLGPKTFWYSADAPSDEKLKLVGQLLEVQKDFVADNSRDEVIKYVKNIFHPFCMLSVRVDACHNLLHGSFMDKSDPYVRVRVASTSWKKTPTVGNTTDPTWDRNNSFPFFPKIMDTTVEIEVKDDDVGTDTSLGDVKINFRDVAYEQWVDKRVSLQGVDKGEVSLSLYCAVGMQDFLNNSIDVLKEVCS